MSRFRACFDLTLTTAARPDGDKLRIEGVANTLRPTQSGRLLHPNAFDEQLRGRVDVPLMVNHGMGRVGGFSTVGRIDAVVKAERGLVFSAWIAKGTPLADEARVLVEQGAVNSLSIGWITDYDDQRQVSIDEPDLDPQLKRLMEEAGRTRLQVFYRARLQEISLVDTPDDADAKLAADADGGAGEDEHGVGVMERLASIERTLKALKLTRGHADVAAVMAAVEERLEEATTVFTNSMLELKECVEEAFNPAIHDYARLLLSTASDDDGGHTCRGDSVDDDGLDEIAEDIRDKRPRSKAREAIDRLAAEPAIDAT